MPHDTNFHSEEAQEILGKIPSWIIRWGITLIFLIFLAIIIGCCFIKYPERVNGTVTITTVCSPIDVVSKSSGNIERIFVNNGDSIKSNVILGVIHSNANYRDILAVERDVMQVNDSVLKFAVFDNWIYKLYDLGDLQSEWTSFSSACLKYRDYIKRAVIEQKKGLLKEQIGKQTEYYSQMKDQADILRNDLKYEEKDYRRDSSLFIHKAISETEYEESARKLLQTRNNVVSFEAQMTSTELSILQNRQQIIELSIQQDDEVLEMEQNINNSKEKLLALIKNWKLSNLLVSPIDGTISFVRKWDEGQFINTGEAFLTVVPKKDYKVIGIVKIPQENFGKIEKGQKVNVRLNGYPYMEYGLLIGVIGYLSSVPEEATDQQSSPQYTAEIVFPNGMKTSYRKELRLIQKMNGTAEIITEERSLMMRLIDPIIALLKSGI
ncbi:HlyD family efflux transporter periplasmic adaptor subunit [Bacteroides sp. An51A]|uniref:HlyD family secretion protein n=1 Tax=Bacteroides sp. An51A TaxID=1965640 RepID=UPI000B36C19A|nr:HlyD family efflux transporter periplasmic adaptor subunit [Bacteroides sp. An51A]OUN77854.1 hypothetical protein B5G04_16725 [Bacteroides sp. An51A]OUN77925.1 hypothetical protein B5G04_17120 [Bacteroides sp. An51A]